MSNLLKWEAIGSNGHAAEAHTLTNEYRLIFKKDDKVELQVGPKFNATSGFRAVVKQEFANRGEAEDFARDFELGMLRQLARHGFANAYEGTARTSVVVRKGGDGLELIFTDHAVRQPMRLRTEVFQTEYSGTNGPVNGMKILLDDGTLLFKMTMGNHSEYDHMAKTASNAALDAQLVRRGKITRREAYQALSRAVARDGMNAHGGVDKDNEIVAGVSRGGTVRFKDATEEFSGRNIAFTDGPNGQVHVVVFGERRSTGRDPQRVTVMERDMDPTQLLTFASQVAIAQNVGAMATNYNDHMDMVMHIAGGDVDTVLNPASRMPYPALQPRILPATPGVSAGVR